MEEKSSSPLNTFSFRRSAAASYSCTFSISHPSISSSSSSSCSENGERFDQIVGGTEAGGVLLLPPFGMGPTTSQRSASMHFLWKWVGVSSSGARGTEDVPDSVIGRLTSRELPRSVCRGYQNGMQPVVRGRLAAASAASCCSSSSAPP